MTEPDERRRENGPAPGRAQAFQLTPREASQVEAAGAVPAPPGPPPPGTMKVDLHCHSEASADCSTPLALFPARCRARGIRVQAITDHNEIWGAQKLQEMVAQGEAGSQGAGDPPAPLEIIVGEEVSTQEGEIIGLYLKERIDPGLSPEETVERILAQGGLVLLPHGFDPLKRWRLQPRALERIAARVDILETFNARISRPRWNQAAVEWAAAHGVLMSAGSDAHTLAGIGSAWVEVPARRVAAPHDLREALQGGVPKGEWTHPVLAYVYKVWDRTLRRFKLR